MTTRLIHSRDGMENIFQAHKGSKSTFCSSFTCPPFGRIMWMGRFLKPHWPSTFSVSLTQENNMQPVWYNRSFREHKDLCVEEVSASNVSIQLSFGQKSTGQNLKDPEEDRGPFSALVRPKYIHTDQAQLIEPLPSLPIIHELQVVKH